MGPAQPRQQQQLEAQTKQRTQHERNTERKTSVSQKSRKENETVKVQTLTVSGVSHQLEVEGGGGSDAEKLERAAAPWDWCFVGAPEAHVHTPNELVDKRDIASMLSLYKVLMDKL